MKQITFDIGRMVKLRIEGWGYSQLGREFGKDHTTIMYHCRRMGLIPAVSELTEKEKARRERAMQTKIEIIGWKRAQPKKIYKYAHLLEDEVVNPGKSYKEYLAESLTRPTEKRYHEIYYKEYAGPTRHDYRTDVAALSTIIEEETRSEPDTFGIEVVQG